MLGWRCHITRRYKVLGGHCCLQAKVIVFVSTCKQVRFLYEAFRKLRPGVPLRALHGRMNQYKRMGGGSPADTADSPWQCRTLHREGVCL